MNFKRLLLTLSLLLSLSSAVSAAVDWQLEKKLDTGTPPLDIAVSADGKYTFVLTEGGTVLIYKADGNIGDKISVGKDFDGIEVSPDGNILFLKSSKNKSVHVISLNFIVNIDTRGSPYKGPANAPVVITVFSDFQ